MIKRYIANYIISDNTEHTNSVLCVDNKSITIHKFERETPHTEFVVGAIVIIEAEYKSQIIEIVESSDNLQEAISRIVSINTKNKLLMTSNIVLIIFMKSSLSFYIEIYICII